MATSEEPASEERPASQDRSESEDRSAPEGRWTKFGVIIAVLSLILTYIGLAASNHWIPFQASPAENQNVSSSNNSSTPGGVSTTSIDLSHTLLTSADMDQAAGGSWESSVVGPQSTENSCFQLPADPLQSTAVSISESAGAQLDEVVESFPTIAVASQAYASFVSNTNNCSWTSTSQQGATSKFTAVNDSNAPSLGSASSLWDIQETLGGLSGGSSAYDGAIWAVRSGTLAAFAWIGVDSSNSPSMATIKSNIEPTLANQLPSHS
jgi:hypothetical protein